MEPNTVTDVKAVDVTNVKNINERLNSNIDTLVKPKAGKSGGENG
jgi:hypothetical protein